MHRQFFLEFQKIELVPLLIRNIKHTIDSAPLLYSDNRYWTFHYSSIGAADLISINETKYAPELGSILST